MHALEEVLVRTLAQFGLKSHTTSDVGVWIDGQRKIAAIGIAVSRWVTMHGTIPAPLLSCHRGEAQGELMRVFHYPKDLR